MNTPLTVRPFLVAMLIAVAAMPTNVYQICRRSVGTLEIEPWLARAGDAVEALVRSAAWVARLWRLGAPIAAAAALALLVADLSHAGPSGVALAVAVAGSTSEPTLAEVKRALDESNRLFEGQFKEVSDKVKELEAKGRAVDPLLLEKLDKLNAAIDAQSKLNEDFISKQAAQEAALKRLRLNAGGAEHEDKATLQLKAFNLATKALAAAYGRPAPSDLDADGYKTYCEAYDKYLRRGERELSEIERRALSVGTDPQGGWLVTPDLSGRIVTRIFETSPMRQYSSQQTISTDALEGAADLEEASFGWVGEMSSRPETNTPNVPAPWRIPVHEAYASPKATQKMLEDANVDVNGWLGKKVGDKIGRGFNTAFVTGNGQSKPRGFASYSTAATPDTSRAWGVFEHIATGTSGGFGTDPNGVNKLLDLIHAIKDPYAAKSAFYMNRTTLGKSRQLTDNSTNGKYVFIPSFIAGQPDTFLGYPVRKLQDMATYSTADALAIAFGDMEETYLIVDRLGMTVLVDPYTGKPFVIFYTRARVGGDVLNFESMKFLKFGTA